MTEKDIIIAINKERLDKDVLVVDDEKIITDLLCCFLKALNIKVESANNIYELEAKLKESKFKVIVLDINFKAEYNGVQMCVDIRKTNKDAKIYAMTGLTGLFDEISPSVAGFDGVFYKPFESECFITTILKDVNYLKS